MQRQGPRAQALDGTRMGFTSQEGEIAEVTMPHRPEEQLLSFLSPCLRLRRSFGRAWQGGSISLNGYRKLEYSGLVHEGKKPKKTDMGHLRLSKIFVCPTYDVLSCKKVGHVPPSDQNSDHQTARVDLTKG